MEEFLPVGRRRFHRILTAATKAHRVPAQPPLNDAFQTDERPAANEQNVRRIYPDILLLRMLSATLRRHVAHRPFQDFQQRLLHALARDIARNGHVFRLARDLVDLVDIHNPALRPLHVVIRILQQAQNDVLHVLAHVTRFGKRGRVGHGKRHIEDLGQRPGQQRFARAGRPDHQNIALLDRDAVVRVGRSRIFCFRRRGRLLENPLVMIVHRHGQRFLGVVLSDAVKVKLASDFRRLGHADAWLALLDLGRQFLVQHLFAEDDAVIADVHARAGDQLLDLGVRFAAETAERDRGGPRHRDYSFLSAKLVARSTNPGICLRDCTTSSTNP